MRAPVAPVAAASAAALTLMLTAAPASAHTSLKESDPAKGSTVAPPSEITLTYNDPVMVPKVVLSDASGKRYESGAAKAADNKVTQPVAGTLPGGEYTVGWRVVAVDGHPITGSFTFTVKASSATSITTTRPASPQSAITLNATEKASEEDSGGSSGWLWIGLAAVAVAAVAGGVAWVRRSG